jgi:hypothetical protein
MKLQLFALTLFWVGLMITTVGYVRHLTDKKRIRCDDS